MSLLVSLLLGLVQGVTEFLPISSSGHLAVLENVFKIKFEEGSNLFFNVMLHLGTLISVIIYYRKELKAMVTEIIDIISGKSAGGRDESGRRLPKLRLSILIGIGTIPLLLVLPIRGYVEQLFGKLGFIAFALLITGGLLFISDRIKPGIKKERNATLFDALLVGLGQAFAVIPGLSRSGTTIVVGLTRGFKRSFAVKFSFMLSIPAVIGSFIIELVNAISSGVNWSMFPIYFAGMLVAAVFGYVSIAVVQILVKKAKMKGLAYYTWGLGIVALIISLINLAI